MRIVHFELGRLAIPSLNKSNQKRTKWLMFDIHVIVSCLFMSHSHMAPIIYCFVLYYDTFRECVIKMGSFLQNCITTGCASSHLMLN